MREAEPEQIFLTTFQNNHVGKEMIHIFFNQGPVVQSVVSLTSSLRVISLTVLADSIHNILIFFQQKISAYLRITRLKF